MFSSFSSGILVVEGWWRWYEDKKRRRRWRKLNVF